MKTNILKPSKNAESVIDDASDDINEKIVPILFGAAAMALIIVLLGLVLVVMYYTNWRRWGNYFLKQSYVICVIKLQDEIERTPF